MKLFRFKDRGSFWSEISTEFAEIIRTSSPEVQQALSEKFGLRAELSSGKYKTSYDGRKVGIGSFVHPRSGQIHFYVAPKTDTLRLRDIFQALGENRAAGRMVHFENTPIGAPAENKESDFSPAFLRGLFDEIIEYSRFLLNVSVKTKLSFVTNGVKGRLVADRSIQNSLLGRQVGFWCKVLDDLGLKEYASVLIATARDISRLLGEWNELVPESEIDWLDKLRPIVSRFGQSSLPPFSRSLLYKACRPPFPYGLREIMYKCLRYWEWQGAFQITEHQFDDFRYQLLYIELDLLFQEYVGQSWNASLHQMENVPKWSPSPKLRYYHGDQARTIDPDHLFWEDNQRILLVVDAKYSENIGDEDHIYQMVSYLSYDYAKRNMSTMKTIGVLVYPADGEWEQTQVTGFDRDLWTIRMPIRSCLFQEELHRFVEDRFTSVAHSPLAK